MTDCSIWWMHYDKLQSLYTVFHANMKKISYFIFGVKNPRNSYVLCPLKSSYFIFREVAKYALCNLFHIFGFWGWLFFHISDFRFFLFFFFLHISYWARLICFIFDGLRVRFIFHIEIFGLSHERETKIETHSFIPWKPDFFTFFQYIKKNVLSSIDHSLLQEEREESKIEEKKRNL